MKVTPYILLVAMLALGGPAFAETVREISASELRKIVGAGQAISLKRAIEAVSAAAGGEPIEARAFDAEGVFYRIVMKRSNGTLVSFIIDAETGKQVAKTSAIGKGVSAAAAAGSDAKPGKGKSQSAGANGNGNGGNSGGNGNGGGNGGGNGNGNGKN